MALSVRKIVERVSGSPLTGISVRADVLPIANSTSTSLRTALSRLGNVHRCAPRVTMHSTESALPMDPVAFVRRSRLRHYVRGPGGDQGYSRVKKRWLTNNSHDPEYYDIPMKTINGLRAHSNGKHRHPCKKPRGKKLNVFLEAKGDLSGSMSPTGRIPVFFYVLNSSSPCCLPWGADYGIQYWWFFGENPGVAPPLDYHQGDWEHMTVLVKGDAPIGAFVAAHGKSKYFTAAKLRKVGPHRFKVFVAKGSHATFESTGTRYKNGVELVDGRGVRWDTWQQLRPLATQPWKDFAGAWGGIRGAGGLHPCTGGSYGPLGPLLQTREGAC
jgi:hypothetical protein